MQGECQPLVTQQPHPILLEEGVGTVWPHETNYIHYHATVLECVCLKLLGTVSRPSLAHTVCCHQRVSLYCYHNGVLVPLDSGSVPGNPHGIQYN